MENTNIHQISGCTFTDIDSGRNYYIQIRKPILFYDNIFQNTEYSETERAGIMWANFGGSLTIKNCKFIRLVTRGVDAHVFNSNNGNRIEYIFDNCEFIDCGKNNTKALVNALHDEASIKFYDCKFIFNSLDKSCRVIDLKSYSATFERCYFTQCGVDAIYLGCSDPNRVEKSTYGTFTFKDNNINKCNKGLFIRADDLRSKPIIEGNTFEDITLINSYMISISHDQNEIIFTNNTFSHITTSGNENGDNGGVGISVFSSNSEYTIKYIKCHFTSITNNHENAPNNHGGALQIGFTNNSNANIEITECEFKNNIVKGGHGGAVAFRTTKSILIKDCIFDMNTANNEEQTDGSKGFGGAIYISASSNSDIQEECITRMTISGCTISNNKGYQGYGIYLQGSQSCQSTILINDKNVFDNNQGTATHPIGGCIIASELININKVDIEELNDFNNLGTSSKFLFVDQLGNPLPNPTETLTKSPTQSPNETPTQSPNETPTQSPTQEITTSEPATSTPEQPTSATSTPEQPTSATSTPEQPTSATSTPEQPTSQIQSPTDLPVPPTEDLSDLIVVEPEDLNDRRYDKVINISAPVKIDIKVTNFTDIDYSGNGGSVHIINSGLYCESILFRNCSSEEGGGGGIYIKNTNSELINPIVIKFIDFTDCKAKYGGAVYIYSCSKKSQVQIIGCTFRENTATEPEDETQNTLYGGSALFLTARKGRAKDNEFIDNKGPGGAVKLYNNFDSQTNNAKIIQDLNQNVNDDEESVIVSECKFTITKYSDCSLFHYQGKFASKLQLNNCIFNGDLAEGAHHIDGINIDNEKPKLTVKGCKFSSDVINAFNLQHKNNKFLLFDKKLQVFETSKSSESKSSFFSLKVLIPSVMSVFGYLTPLRKFRYSIPIYKHTLNKKLFVELFIRRKHYY